MPLGVVGVISPWNWPYTMGAEILAPALAAGNTVVWVPAPTTTACCAVLAEVIAGAGLPAGVFNFVPGPGPGGRRRAGRASGRGRGRLRRLGRHRGQRRGAGAGKAQLLELGGNGPMVVLADADVELAAAAARWRRPTCAPARAAPPASDSSSRRGIRAVFVERVVAATKAAVRLGDPFDPETTMGPLNNEATAAKFDRHIADAVAGGARVCCGGARAAGFPTPLYAEPTVLDGVTPGMAIEREETFGPVVPVVEVASAAQALELTNASPFGLTAAVFTADLERGLAFAERARAGWVNINASTNLWESHLPFGGRAGSISGRGRVGGRYPMDDLHRAQDGRLPGPALLLSPLPPSELPYSPGSTRMPAPAGGRAGPGDLTLGV